MSIFDQNIKILKQEYSDLAELVAQPLSMDHIKISTATNGDVRLLIQSADGEWIHFHNENAPTDVAKRSAEKVSALGGVLVLLGRLLRSSTYSESTSSLDRSRFSIRPTVLTPRCSPARASI